VALHLLLVVGLSHLLLVVGGAPFAVKGADFDLRFQGFTFLSFPGASLFPVFGKGGRLA
jgi:hypothetical protein